MARHSSLRGGFTRQVNFRIGFEDWPLLEAAAREHGGIQAALLAGLRALAEKRLAASGAPAALPPEPTEPPDGGVPGASGEQEEAREVRPPRAARQAPGGGPPTSEAEGDWWMPLGTVAALLKMKPQTVRRWAEESKTRSFRTEGGAQDVRLDTLEVPRHVAAGLVGVKSDTLGKRVKAGRLVEARPGHIRLGDLELTTVQAAARLGVTSATVRKRIERGDLPARNVNGGSALRLLDVVAAIE